MHTVTIKTVELVYQKNKFGRLVDWSPMMVINAGRLDQFKMSLYDSSERKLDGHNKGDMIRFLQGNPHRDITLLIGMTLPVSKVGRITKTTSKIVDKLFENNR